MRTKIERYDDYEGMEISKVVEIDDHGREKRIIGWLVGNDPERLPSLDDARAKARRISRDRGYRESREGPSMGI